MKCIDVGSELLGCFKASRAVFTSRVEGACMVFVQMNVEIKFCCKPLAAVQAGEAFYALMYIPNVLVEMGFVGKGISTVAANKILSPFVHR